MTLFSSQPGDDGLPGPARARVMAAVMTTTLMGVFDGTMVNIALPSMAQELQASASTAVWFANGYLLAAAMTLAIFAALAARFGYRPVFLAGLTTFIMASAGCALATTPELLIGMRVLQGIGGAATLSIAPAILRSVFPARLLGRILGIHALLIASSSAIGPVLGGLNLRSAHLDAGIDDFCRGFNPSGDAARYARRVGYLPAEPGMRYWLWLLPEPE